LLKDGLLYVSREEEDLKPFMDSESDEEIKAGSGGVKAGSIIEIAVISSPWTSCEVLMAGS
jgi:hypothetical protein